MSKDIERRLTPNERHIVEKCCDIDPSVFAKYTDIQYTKQGNFTVCNIISLNGYAIRTGVAKRRPEDDDSASAGFNISFMRAIKCNPKVLEW